MDLSSADLINADLTRAHLHDANLMRADLNGANFEEAFLSHTILSDVNLSTVKGLQSCRYYGPSVIDHQTLIKSGRLPLKFLRGCGLPDSLIEYLPSLLNELIQFYSCFISHSSKD